MPRYNFANTRNALISGLVGTARKLVLDGAPRDQALAILRGMADNDTDVLTEAGATQAGCWFGQPGTDPTGIDLATSALLLGAGIRVEPADVRRWVKVGYDRTHHGGPLRAD